MVHGRTSSGGVRDGGLASVGVVWRGAWSAHVDGGGTEVAEEREHEQRARGGDLIDRVACEAAEHAAPLSAVRVEREDGGIKVGEVVKELALLKRVQHRAVGHRVHRAAHHEADRALCARPHATSTRTSPRASPTWTWCAHACVCRRSNGGGAGLRSARRSGRCSVLSVERVPRSAKRSVSSSFGPNLCARTCAMSNCKSAHRRESDSGVSSRAREALARACD
jgi:hypothetical protein